MSDGPKNALSPRELEIIACFATGKSTKYIAKMLGVSPRTVDAHAASIHRKLHAANRAHAVAVAICSGMIPAERHAPSWAQAHDTRALVAAPGGGGEHIGPVIVQYPPI
jgi:DNA-binding CsgD family transcriptional regulator